MDQRVAFRVKSARSRYLPSLVLIVVALFAVWLSPFVLSRQGSAAAVVALAPVRRDYLQRDRLVAFYEHEVRQDPLDQISLRMLAQQYMQRFRERYDLNDITRTIEASEESIRLAPSGNTGAQAALASAYLAYHQFSRARVHELAAFEAEPGNPNARAQLASLAMETGDYADAKRDLDAIGNGPDENPTVDSIRARYDEVTGNLEAARLLLGRALATVDSVEDNSAYDRSWFHMRAGQLAFEAGDPSAADAEFATSLALYPDNSMALMFAARSFRAERRWRETLAAASRSATLYPLPQALGYQADAQRELGDATAARRTDALIAAEGRIFDSQGINDRLLAVYYAQRGEHLAAALRAASSDYHKRGDEVYSDDTMAWVLARSNRWAEARPYADRATRMGTQDSEILYHAGVIALHDGDVPRGRGLLEAALRISPDFDPYDAPAAQSALTNHP